MQPQNNADGSVSLRIPSGTPLFTYGLLVTLLVAALARFAAPPTGDIALTLLGLQGDAVLNGQQFYRLFTALLLLPTPAITGVTSGLYGVGVLLISLYTLYTVGVEMEKLWGTPRTILIYTLGGAFGAAATLLLVPAGLLGMDVPLGTAPGGLLALIGAQMVYLFKHRRLYRRMAPQRQAFLLVIGVTNLVISAFAAGTDFNGTLAALLGGGALAAFISPFMLPRQHPDDPNALLAEDVNPLRGRLFHITGAVVLIMALVALGVFLTR